tara:strand:+ start:201 stop:407 length:207 start_codon:yes stop_codon:yes gene_type:complete
MSEELKYSERMREIDSIITKLRTSDDVDEAMKLFESGCDHLKFCKEKIEKAKGKYEEILSNHAELSSS